MEQIGFTPRLLDVKGLMQYTSLGRNNAMELGKKAEAVKDTAQEFCMTD